MINLRAHVSSLAVFNDFQETLSVAICIRKKTANVAWDSWETLDADFHINGQERSMIYFLKLHSKPLLFCPIMNMLLLKMFNHWSSILEQP